MVQFFRDRLDLSLHFCKRAVVIRWIVIWRMRLWQHRRERLVRPAQDRRRRKDELPRRTEAGRSPGAGKVNSALAPCAPPSPCIPHSRNFLAGGRRVGEGGLQVPPLGTE